MNKETEKSRAWQYAYMYMIKTKDRMPLFSLAHEKHGKKMRNKGSHLLNFNYGKKNKRRCEYHNDDDENESLDAPSA